MYIAPDSTIKLCSGVPFNNQYVDVTKFSNQSEQLAYFASKIKVNYIKQSYIVRDGDKLTNTVRLACSPDDVYDCNYLYFQNSAFGNKWFFAFITGVKYINNNTTEITYEIDVIQTWQFVWTIRQSFVEREHPLTDNIGENLLPENLEIGEYTYTDLGVTGMFNSPQIVMACTFDKDFNDAVGGMYGGVYSGLCYNVFSTYEQANSFIAQATSENKADGIISIFMLPIAFCYGFSSTNPELYEIERNKQYNTIGGYTPRNNKLFTFPYNTLYVTNNEGLSANFPFEYFGTEKCNFELVGSMSAVPEVALIPKYYKDVMKNYNEKLTVGNFPQCAFTVDTYKAWIAQNSTRITTDVVTNVTKAVGGGALMYATGGLLGGGMVASGVGGIANILAKERDTMSQPPHAKGTHSTNINMVVGRKGFTFYYAQIRAEFAKIIDDYFDKFGYKCNQVKIPNINTRPNWNYVKTIDVTITGNIPSTDTQKICDIFNKGVTFWRNPNNVGNYNLNNRP